jgi:hypothetical protein
MRKFHWISMALVVAPFAFTGACGGDDTTTGGGAGTSAGSSGSGGSGTAGTNSSGGSSGTATSVGGSSGSGTSGSGGSAGAGTGGMAGTAAPEGGAGSAGAGSGDAAAETASDDGSSTKCTNGQAAGGDGKSCADVCGAYFMYCTTIAATMNTYASSAACVSACKALTQTQLCCRAQHGATILGASAATRTMDYLNMHCPHVIGKDPCT